MFPEAKQLFGQGCENNYYLDSTGTWLSRVSRYKTWFVTSLSRLGPWFWHMARDACSSNSIVPLNQNTEKYIEGWQSTLEFNFKYGFMSENHIFNIHDLSHAGGILPLWTRRRLWRHKIQSFGDREEKWWAGIEARPGKIWSSIHFHQCW